MRSQSRRHAWYELKRLSFAAMRCRYATRSATFRKPDASMNEFGGSAGDDEPDERCHVAVDGAAAGPDVGSSVTMPDQARCFSVGVASWHCAAPKKTRGEV